MSDLSAREWWLLAPIAGAVLWMGVYPETFMRPIRNDVGRLLERIERVRPKGDSALTLGKGKIAPGDHGEGIDDGGSNGHEASAEDHGAGH